MISDRPNCFQQVREGRRSAWAPVCRGGLVETAYAQLRGISVGFRIAQRPVLRAGLCMVFLAAALFCAPAPLWAEVTATGDGNPFFTGTEPDPWNVSGEIWIGNTGTGTLSVENGGSVTGTTGYLGYSSTGDGTATVTGTDSSWTNSGGLYIGGSSSSAGGTGTVSVLDGGTLSVGGATKIYSDSTLTLGTGTFTSGGIVMEGGSIAASTPAGEEGDCFGRCRSALWLWRH